MPEGIQFRALESGGDERARLMNMIQSTVLSQFYTSNVLWDSNFIDIQQLAPGVKSHQFPIFGDSTADPEYHVPGQLMLGDTFAMGDVTITLDDILYKATRIPKVDIRLSAWDIIGKSVAGLTRRMTEKLNKNLLLVGLNAARTAAVSNVHPGGNVVTRTAASLAAAYPVNSTGADNFCADAGTLAAQWDDDNIPDDGNRYLFISSHLRNVLTKSGRAMNRDYVTAADGDLARRVIGTLESFNVVTMPTSLFPTTAITTGLSKYQGDFTVGGAARLPAALALYRDEQGAAVGAVQAAGLSSYIENNEETNETFMKVETHIGMGVYKAWLAGEIGVHS